MDDFNGMRSDHLGRGLYSGHEIMGRFSKYKLFEIEEVKRSKEEKKVLVKALEDGSHDGQKVVWYKPAEYYIVPDDNAVLDNREYNAFNDYPDILIDFIEMARWLRTDKGSDAAARILGF